MMEMAMPEVIKNLLSSTVTENEDCIDGFKKWSESTSSPPSGCHLGPHMAIIKDPDKKKCGLSFAELYTNKVINFLTLKYIFTPTRWCGNSVTAQIEKHPESPKIEQLYIMHLFEANYNNFCLKLRWGRRLIQQGANNGCFGHPQFGSHPNHKALGAVHQKSLTYDLSRFQQTNLAITNNNHSGCYDCRVAYCVPPGNNCSTMTIRYEAKRVVQMTNMHGISDQFYKATELHPLYHGTSQGNRVSPAEFG